MANMKSDKEIIHELVEIVIEAISGNTGGNMLMMRPALNIVKLKLSQMDDKDCTDIIDKVHFISHHIEKETGKLSPYHAIENIN